jgi:hypothetical protein
MTYTGKVEKGVVVFDGLVKPLEGARVQVSECDHEITNGSPATPSNGVPAPSIWDGLKQLNGTAKGLSPDMAANHDHYIHGTLKRKIS